IRVRTLVSKAKSCATRQPVFPCQSSHKTSCKRRRHETEFYARQASILLGNNACRSGNDRSPTLKVFFALSRGRRGTQRALNSVSCLLLPQAPVQPAQPQAYGYPPPPPQPGGRGGAGGFLQGALSTAAGVAGGGV